MLNEYWAKLSFRMYPLSGWIVDFAGANLSLKKICDSRQASDHQIYWFNAIIDRLFMCWHFFLLCFDLNKGTLIWYVALRKTIFVTWRLTINGCWRFYYNEVGYQHFKVVWYCDFELKETKWCHYAWRKFGKCLWVNPICLKSITY